jgi:methyl-accepting chemotaxis protein
MFLLNFSIRRKILVLFSAFALVAVLITGLSLLTMFEYDRILDENNMARDNVVYIEKAKAIVSTVSRATREAYLAADTYSALRHAKAAEDGLAALVPLMATWAQNISPTERDSFLTLRQETKIFISLQNKLISLSKNKGSAFVSLINDPTAYRQNTLKMSQDFDLVAVSTQLRLERSQARATNFRDIRGVQFIVLAFSGLAAVLGASLWMALKTLSEPLTRINKTIVNLSNGIYDHDLPALKSQDEIARVWTALGVLKDKAIENERLTAQKFENERREERTLREIMFD